MKIDGEHWLERNLRQRIPKGDRRQRIDDRNAKPARRQGTSGKGRLAFDCDFGPRVRLVKSADHMLARRGFAGERNHWNTVEIPWRQELPPCQGMGWLHHADAC